MKLNPEMGSIATRPLQQRRDRMREGAPARKMRGSCGFLRNAAFAYVQCTWVLPESASAGSSNGIAFLDVIKKLEVRFFMAMQMSVDNFATLLHVTAKTVREYVRVGMPVARSGDKGPGNGALIDVARALPWLKRNTRVFGEPVRETFADHLLTQPMAKRNPLRWSVELYHDCAIRIIAAALGGWHRDCPEEWRKLGLTDKQMRALVWKLFGVLALTLLQFKLKSFDEAVRMQADGADLDDLASLYFQGDIRTDFVDRIEFPRTLKEYEPPGLAAALKYEDSDES